MNDGRVILVAGFTGSGKSAWVIQNCHRSSRLLVWDSDQEWSKRGLVEPVYSIDALKDRLVADIRRSGRLRLGYAGPIRLVLQPTTPGGKPRDIPLFPVFCRLAWAWIRSAPGKTLVVEELADVTHPGKAPADWGEIVRKSRKHGADVYGLAQRPAEIDKTIVSNAAEIHSGFLGFPDDRAYIAKCLGVDVREIEKLQPLDYLHRNLRTQKLTRGRIRFQ
jgi:hypothetical protein